jgi:hypothetical protein
VGSVEAGFLLQKVRVHPQERRQGVHGIDDTERGLFVWLVADADLFREKNTADWLLVADLFGEKSAVDS